MRYKDEVEKLNFYKKKIMQELTQKGIYPDDISVKKRLDAIDAKLAVFQFIDYEEGSTFDTKKFNEDFIRIGQDLCILYKLAYQICIKEFQELQAFAETHLTELENMARRYEYKTKFEIESTSLGKTVYFQTNGFNVQTENTMAIIKLGALSVENGSKLACLFDGNNIRQEQVIFSFDNQNCSPYDYNRDFFTVPGAVNCESYKYELPESTNVTSAIEMNVMGLTPNKQNKYIIYGGKEQIALGYYSKTFASKEAGLPVSLTGGGKISFYIVGGSFVNFDFSKQPVSKNFTGTRVENLKKHHKIVLEYSGSFTFDCETDGIIYATQTEGIIKDDKLYYPNADMVNSFLVEEYMTGKTTAYEDVRITISGLKEDAALHINSVAIKQLSTIEGVD